MKKSLAAMLFVSLPAAHAEQFDSIIDALAIPYSALQTNNGWDSTAKIKGARWAWPYSESGRHNNTMTGTLKRNTKLVVEGARDFVSSVTIVIANDNPDIKEFGKGQVTKITTTCDDDSMSEGVAFYQFVKPGHKPLYVRYHATFGAGGAGGAKYNVAYDLRDSLETLWPNPCKVTNK